MNIKKNKNKKRYKKLFFKIIWIYNYNNKIKFQFYSIIESNNEIILVKKIYNPNNNKKYHIILTIEIYKNYRN